MMAIRIIGIAGSMAGPKDFLRKMDYFALR
jgi:hypothetical protein